MERVVRAFPVSSRQALEDFATDIQSHSVDERQPFFDNFPHAIEYWYFQEIEGKPYVIAIAEGENLEAGFRKLAELEDPFSVWFKSEVLALTGINLNEAPKGPPCEHLFSFSDGSAEGRSIEH